MSHWTDEQKAKTRQQLKQLPPDELRKIVLDKNEDDVIRVMAQTVLLVYDPHPPAVTR